MQKKEEDGFQVTDFMKGIGNCASPALTISMPPDPLRPQVLLQEK
jgi:hypothetical protein